MGEDLPCLRVMISLRVMIPIAVTTTVIYEWSQDGDYRQIAVSALASELRSQIEMHVKRIELWRFSHVGRSAAGPRMALAKAEGRAKLLGQQNNSSL